MHGLKRVKTKATVLSGARKVMQVRLHMVGPFIPHSVMPRYGNDQTNPLNRVFWGACFAIFKLKVFDHRSIKSAFGKKTGQPELGEAGLGENQ